MRYDYFGNTTLRPKTLLYNIEKQLFLFDELFTTAKEGEEWAGNNSILQEKYYYMLIENKLLVTKTSLKLGTKDARAKSSPLENLHLINRNQKIVTPLGKELLSILKNKFYLKYNSFLQIDLVSLFFLKTFFGYSKVTTSSQMNDFSYYLSCFKYGGGYLSKTQFLLLPLFKNYSYQLKRVFFHKNLNYHKFIEIIIKNDSRISEKKELFIASYAVNDFDSCIELLKSGNGGNSGKIAFELLDILIKLKTKSYSSLDIEQLFKNSIIFF